MRLNRESTSLRERRTRTPLGLVVHALALRLGALLAPRLERCAPALSLLLERLEPFLAVGTKRRGQRLRDDQIAVPLRVRRDDAPGRVRRGAARDGVLVRFGELVPLLALLPVVERELPGVDGIVLAREQPP